MSYKKNDNLPKTNLIHFVLTYFRKIQAGTGSFSIRFASFSRLGPYLPHYLAVAVAVAEHVTVAIGEV